MPRAIRPLVLTLVFGVQIAGIAYARVADTRYLSWAPYDQLAFYRIEASREDVALSPAEVAARYRMPETGRENRSIHHVFQAIAQYEATYGRADVVTARVVYRVNGGREQVWMSAR